MKKIFKKLWIIVILAMVGLSIATDVHRVDQLMKELNKDDD